ncbi:MAG: HAD family hydrolase [Saprospiraceae bacterium]
MKASKPTWTPPNIEWASVGAIVFDLGNVLIDLDNDFYGKGWPAGINAQDLETFKTWVAEQGLWLKYEKGHVPTSTFVELLSSRLQLSPKQVTDYWNRILLGIQPKRFTLLDALKERFPLYVLSNTNDLHIEWVRKHVIDLGVADFETQFFEQIFYSYEVGAVKPEPEIYAAAEHGINLPSNQLLFIDDRPENIEAAMARGWQAVLLPPEIEVEAVFSNLLA